MIINMNNHVIVNLRLKFLLKNVSTEVSLLLEDVYCRIQTENNEQWKNVILCELFRSSSRILV